MCHVLHALRPTQLTEVVCAFDLYKAQQLLPGRGSQACLMHWIVCDPTLDRIRERWLQKAFVTHRSWEMFLEVDIYNMIVCASRVIFVKSYVLQQEAQLHSDNLLLLVGFRRAKVAIRLGHSVLMKIHDGRVIYVLRVQHYATKLPATAIVYNSIADRGQCTGL